MTQVKLLVTGDGTDYANEFPVGSAAVPPHYDKIDEDPADDDTTFIETDETLTPYINNFLKETLSLPAGATINFVRVLARVRRDPNPIWPTTPTGDLGFLIGGTGYFSGLAINPTSSYVDYTRDFTVNPNTGLAWTEAGVNGAEIRVKGISSRILKFSIWYYSFYRVTQVYLMVDYTEAVVAEKPLMDGFVFVS